MAKGGSGDSTVTNKTEIDPTTQAWRNNIFGAATNLWNQGIPGYYPGNTVVPFSNQTQQGLNMLQRQALTGRSNAPGYNAALQALGGLFSQQSPFGMKTAQNLSAGATPGQHTLLNQSGDMLRGGANGLENIAGGEMAMQQLGGLFNQGASQIGDAVNGQFAAAGRFGAPGAHTGTLGREIGNLWDRVYTPAFENNQNRMLAASQGLAGLGQQGLGMYLDSRMGGAQLAGDLQSQHYQDQARGMAMMPTLWQYGAQPGQQMLGIGNSYEGLAQDYLNADRERYNYNANSGWDYLQRYSNLMTGMPDFSGSTQTTQGPGSNPIMGGLGGGLLGYGAADAMGLLGSGFMGGPWGMGLAGLGALGGLFS